MNKRFDRVERSLLEDYSIEMVKGHKPKQLLPSSFLSFKLTDHIEKKYAQKIDFKIHKLLSYDFSIYKALTGISISMTICKYRPETLYREHIIFVCIKVLVTYFYLYDKTGLLVNLKDMAPISKAVLETDINVFYIIAERLGFRYIQHNEVVIGRSLNREQVIAMVEPGDSQTTIKKKIMKACPCGERKARNIMRTYGLTNQKFTRKDFKKSSEDEI